MSSAPMILFWFRRDLRIEDNHGLAQALGGSQTVHPIFIFDTDILNALERDDSRVSFLHQVIRDLDMDLRSHGSRLHVYHGRPLDIFKKLFKQHKILEVVVNEDYEPYARKRDGEIAAFTKAHGAKFSAYKDQVVFAKGEIVKDDGQPYIVFTPYSRRWLARFETEKIPSYPSVKRLEASTGQARTIEKGKGVPTLAELGFKASKIPVLQTKIHPSMVKAYAERRDFLAQDATTKIGVHLRFGTLSVRNAARMADKYSSAWLNELIWREFFQAILYHFPHTASEPFDPRFKKFPWRKNDSDFQAWRDGRTGYPLVDAGMRELNATGFMHNRARMIAGSFLCKHLLLDWRLGERHFAAKLFDFDLAANIGNWQWVAGCGVDAAPYFRIFNPKLQAERFDPDCEYIRRWVPELGTEKYPAPMVDHEMARRRALIAYEKIKTRKRTEEGLSP